MVFTGLRLFLKRFVYPHIFPLSMVVLSAYLASEYTVRGQRAAGLAQAVALQEVIRFEGYQNIYAIERAVSDTEKAVLELQAFIKGQADAPPIRPSHMVLATIGLRTQLESPSAHLVDHRLLAAYALVYGRMVRYEETQLTVEARADQYASIQNVQEKREAAEHLITALVHQREVGAPLQESLPEFLTCLETFASGEEICEPSGIRGHLDTGERTD